MSKVNHDLRSHNGVTIWLPPEPQTPEVVNLKLPNIRSEDASQLYPIGTKMTTDDRVFRYCLADTAAIVRADYGAGNNNRHMEGDAIGNAVAGAYTLNWRVEDCDYDTVAYQTVNCYEGGYIWIMNADVSLWEFHKIVSNLVATGSTKATDYTTLTLADPITTASTTPWCTAYRNIYSDVRNSYPTHPSNKQAVVAVPHICASIDTYFWGQTWGPMWTTAHNTTPGAAQYHRELIFMQGGTIAIQTEWTPVTYAHQRAGYCLTDTLNTGDMMYMLQLAP